MIISYTDESYLSVFFCFYLIIFIVTLNFYRVLNNKKKIDELEAFPCVPQLVVFHFINIIFPLINVLFVGLLSLVFSSLLSYPAAYIPTAFSLVYNDAMADWMVVLVLIYSFTLSYDLPRTFHFKYFKVPRDALIWMAMLTYGFMFNSLNPWDILTIRRNPHENGHISTSFNFVDAFLLAISIVFMLLHGYRMSFSNAFRDNRYHITMLFIMIKLAFLITGACFIPAMTNYPNDSKSAHVFTLDNLKLYESVVQSAVPLHYLAWKHLFFKNV